MPFKSEAQRKYLWANEPKIARDWTDTYGSRIQKAGGQLVQPGPGRPGYQGGHQETYDAGKSYEAAKADSRPGGGADAWQRQALQQFAQLPASATTVSKSTPKVSLGERINTAANKYIPGRLRNLQKRRGSYIDKNPAVFDALLKQGLIEETGGVGAWDWTGEGGIESEAAKQALWDEGYTGGRANVNDPNHPNYDPGGGGGVDPYPYTGIATLPATTDTTTTASTGLGSGHFQVPLDLVLNQQRAADGGRIGYQMGNMVEGEMEGAMMQSKEVIKELYDALIAQGLSPQEAIEKIKEIIASSQAEGPQSPMMGEEFPGQEFGGGPRAPAAFGGIMDTYTGRRKYGIGSKLKKAFGVVADPLKKIVKKVKSLASSKLGKIALMYMAGTYLGGTQFMSGIPGGVGPGGLKSVAARLKDPRLLANLLKTDQWGTAGEAAKVAQIGQAQQAGAITQGLTAANQYSPHLAAGYNPNLNPLAKEVVKKGGDWSKWILPASIGAGAYTAYAPVKGLDDTQSKWDEDKEAFDAYLASLGGSYRVPEDLRLTSAQGGRIGRQEGGLMDLGGMEKDYRNDGGFVPIGGQEKADDVPARLSRNEFVFTADAVRNAGGGDIDRGAEVMENVMKNLEAGGQVSEESQGQGAQEMFETSERLSEVI